MSRTAVPFWDRVDKAGPDDCWLWTSATTKGYGSVWHNGRMQYAHRVAWERTEGVPAPGHLEVCHHCDVPPCCNPRHLFLGTHAENMADAAAKGRMTNVRRKLSAADAFMITGLRDAGAAPKAIAEWYGVNRGTIYGVSNARRRLRAGAAS
jgi:hypothetical protein